MLKNGTNYGDYFFIQRGFFLIFEMNLKQYNGIKYKRYFTDLNGTGLELPINYYFP